MSGTDGARVRAFNLGNGSSFSVRVVIDAVERVTVRPMPVHTGARRPGDPPVLVGDATRSRRELGWVPQLPGLEQIVATAMKRGTRLRG